MLYAHDSKEFIDKAMKTLVAALSEIYLLHEYDWEPFENPHVIVDLGAHSGDTAVYYHLRYPEATIIAVEPSPESFRRLKANTRTIKNIIPVQAAIGDHDGDAVLYIAPSSLGSSLKRRSDTSRTVSVPMITLGSLFARFSIRKADILKFDIEGGEQFLFAEKAPAEFARAYIGEVHGDLMDIPAAEFTGQFDGVFELELRKLGANRFMLRAKSNKL